VIFLVVVIPTTYTDTASLDVMVLCDLVPDESTCALCVDSLVETDLPEQLILLLPID